MQPPTIKQIKECEDKEQLLTWRDWLRENVVNLIEEKILDWENYEKLICHLDNKIDPGCPVIVDLPILHGQTKRTRV